MTLWDQPGRPQGDRAKRVSMLILRCWAWGRSRRGEVPRVDNCGVYSERMWELSWKWKRGQPVSWFLVHEETVG